MTEYISSIVFKYGDTDKVAIDSQTISEIIRRQGTSLLIDCIAESAGTTANKFKMPAIKRKNLKNSIINELINALNERL